jgi:hypothetical protein
MNSIIRISRIQIPSIFYPFELYLFKLKRPFSSQLKRPKKFRCPFAIMGFLVHAWVSAIFCLRNRG